MYKNVMVPLDGSELAECVLPHVEALVKAGLTENVTLLRVVEPFQYFAGEVGLPAVYSEYKTEAEAYVNQLVSRLKYEKATVKGEVIEGPVAERLADYAAKKKFDLIIMATHGRSGMSRWVWGSVADRLLRSAPVPVLIVRAPGCGPGTKT